MPYRALRWPASPVTALALAHVACYQRQPHGSGVRPVPGGAARRRTVCPPHVVSLLAVCSVAAGPRSPCQREHVLQQAPQKPGAVPGAAGAFLGSAASASARTRHACSSRTRPHRCSAHRHAARMALDMRKHAPHARHRVGHARGRRRRRASRSVVRARTSASGAASPSAASHVSIALARRTGPRSARCCRRTRTKKQRSARLLVFPSIRPPVRLPARSPPIPRGTNAVLTGRWCGL
jgi:hypothetical protein